MRYVDAGVDIAAADEALAKVKETVRSTFGPHVVTDLGNFAGLSTLPGGRPDQLLVTSMDGVGTKIKIAIEMGIFNTVGQDLVNHCVGDIGVHGAEPLLFLDYVGMGKLDQSVVTGVIEGLATACRANGCALIGGETAEMPGVYSPPDFDLVGTIIGTVDRSVYVDGSTIEEGDLLFGIPSTGLHTNGFSLVRRVFEQAQIRYRDQAPFSARTLGEELLEVHRSYLAELRALRPSM
ncbi:MAG: phosphoribosylformylglycinamidine cyclo-ligase, partial [Candidatus Eisenbacteria bacterium]|nr:phosphoribosylformylglycinamidine cyclo-ligase [Candidatus Eisenbacteria bacterium]